MTRESGVQSRIRKHLEKLGHYPVRIRTVTVAGTPDLIVCVNGCFVGLEIKAPGARTDKGREARQRRQAELIRQAGGFAFTVSSIKETDAVLAIVNGVTFNDT